MNKFLKNIFLKIANVLGLELADKTEEVNDFYDIKNLSTTATLSNRLASITLMDSKIKVEGTSERAAMIQELATEVFEEHLLDACTFALGTGSALIKPNTDGERFGFDIIPQENYEVLRHTGKHITSILIKVEEYEENKQNYTLCEVQTIKTDLAGKKYIEIRYFTFRDGDPCPMSETHWELNDYVIPNVDRLLLGRIKCPVTNRADVNSVNGVGITFGLSEVSKNVKESYDQYNDERKEKKTMIFASKSLFKKDDKGKVIMPKNGINFMPVSNRGVDESILDTFSPEIRDESLDRVIERNWRTLEQGAGLGEGILSKSTLTYTNMDEVRASKSPTYAFMNSLRRQIDTCMDDLMQAIDVIANYNNLPRGGWEMRIEWSDTYMSSASERFAQYVQAENQGWIEKAEGRALLMNEDIDESREVIEKLKGEEDRRMDDEFDSEV